MTAGACHAIVDASLDANCVGTNSNAGGPQLALLDGGAQLHLQHGPIDLLLRTEGSSEAVQRAWLFAQQRFATVLQELVGELPGLRAQISEAHTKCPFRGAVARRMWAATRPLAKHAFVTSMAAVAGAVADELLFAMRCQTLALSRVSVNNGGDIALYLAPGKKFQVGIVADPRRATIDASIQIAAADNIQGIATSGRHGRSHSLGIADSVTVLARTAAQADAAATLIANAVDLPNHPAIVRVPANSLQPDSDLGNRLVTQSVGDLADDQIDLALQRGNARAIAMQRAGHIVGGYLCLRGQQRIVGAAVTFPS